MIQEQPHLAIHDPITGELIAQLPDQPPEAIADAVARARAAQPGWYALGVHERGRRLAAWADRLWRDRETIIATIRRETGKTSGSAFAEVGVIDNTTHYYAKHAPRILRDQPRRTIYPLIQRGRVGYQPWGVVGFITPWNYPLLNALVDLIPALIAGNTAVIKPSEVAPMSALQAVAWMHEAGVPHDVVIAVTGGAAAGAALIDHVDMIAFTGSTATGRKVAVRAAERLIPVSLELGGKDPVIVLADADLDLAAAETIAAKFENAGQTCVSIERVYVEAAVYEPFLDKLMARMNRLVVSANPSYHIHIGSMTNARELERVEAHIADAVAHGAQVAFGGARRDDIGPLFFAPTLLTNVSHAMRVMREETFGPVLPIMRVRDADEAVRLANDSEYALSATIFTRNLARGSALARRIVAGDVSINKPQYIMANPDLPMGGMRHSGIGRRNGPEGLLRFVQPQSYLIDRGALRSESLLQADPLTRRLYPVLRSLRRRLPLW